MILLCIVVFIYFIFNITSIVNVFMLNIKKKKNDIKNDKNCVKEATYHILSGNFLWKQSSWWCNVISIRKIWLQKMLPFVLLNSSVYPDIFGQINYHITWRLIFLKKNSLENILPSLLLTQNLFIQYLNNTNFSLFMT